MRTYWILAVAFSLFLATATVASAQSTAAPPQSAAGRVTHGKLIKLGKTSPHSPKTGTTATPAAHSTPTQIIDEPALIKLMYKNNAKVPMPRIVETTRSSKRMRRSASGDRPLRSTALTTRTAVM